MDDQRRPERIQQRLEQLAIGGRPPPEPPERPELAREEEDEPDDEVVPDGRYEPL